MTPKEQLTPIAEYGWKAAIGFVVTGGLGLLALATRKAAPILGEKLARVYVERAFAEELKRGRETAAAVLRIEPTLDGLCSRHDQLATDTNKGFRTVARDNRLTRREMRKSTQRLEEVVRGFAQQLGQVQGVKGGELPTLIDSAASRSSR